MKKISLGLFNLLFLAASYYFFGSTFAVYMLLMVGTLFMIPPVLRKLDSKRS